MFEPISASQNITDEYISYIATSHRIKDKKLNQQFLEQLEKEGLISKGPYLEITGTYASGKSLEQLAQEGVVSELFFELEPGLNESEKEIKLQRPLYRHQEQAIRKLAEHKNIVVTTGTGSGKTESFLLPIIDSLLREKEAGTLSDGVRAILIYPMNALANDQMKRMRAIFNQYPDITFGVYNSSTVEDNKEAINKYKALYKDASNRGLEPLKNEIISREKMRSNPPHILVTNYAMLEYMMLRPKDDAVFSESQLHFLVLDEAHIYKGATGIETSVLMRRLKARISEPGKVCHILTSATLGGKEADESIVAFAKALCDSNFDTEDIIRSETIMPALPKRQKVYPLALYHELAHPETSLNNILDKYGVQYEKGTKDAEILFNLCQSSPIYKELRSLLIKPQTIQEIVQRMPAELGVKEQDLVNFIQVASQAEKGKVPLFKARYHMFIRALEGAYISFTPEMELSLIRTQSKETGDQEVKVFEAAVCDDCGSLALAGRIHGDRLEFTNGTTDPETRYFFPTDQLGTEETGEGEIEPEEYCLCTKCGYIRHASQSYSMKCGHDSKYFISVKASPQSKNRCPGCGTGHLRLFYLGSDAATGVLGTELFEQLPEKEVKLESCSEIASPPKTSSLFGPKKISHGLPITEKKARQFLSFSDSRSEAAYYASYMSSYYKEFLRRRGIWHVLQKNLSEMEKQPWEISTFVEELTAYFDENRSFAEPGDTGKESLTAISRKQAWIAILNEMVGARRNSSLSSLGVLHFEFKENTDENLTGFAQKYGKSLKDVKALFNLLVMDMVYTGALEAGNVNLTDEDKTYIYFTTRIPRFAKVKEASVDSKKSWVHGWIPRVKENGKRYSNNRVKRLMTGLDIPENEAVEILEQYWDGLLLGMGCLKHSQRDEYYFETDQFVVVPGTEKYPVYRCDKCGKTTMFNFENRCASAKCDGHLVQVDHKEMVEGNHFARLYASNKMAPLHIREHTAQLSRQEQKEYQEQFVTKKINALSCSTTFEMGVDVGDLETVLLRNVPPSPANYVQRAGRAGRSLHSAAYALTYAKLGSHDFTYYKHPEDLITGKIGVPVFSLQNEKVLLRHVYAVALSWFFAMNEDVYNGNDADIMLNGNGYERLKEFLEKKPEHLKELLKKSIPDQMHEILGIDDFSWLKYLIGSEDGVLQIAVDDFRNTVAMFESEIRKLRRKNDMENAGNAERRLKGFRRSKEDGRGRNELIEFLVRNNCLPKYGFPVDTVELHTSSKFETLNDDKRLSIVRDLQLAVAEYAPGSQVIANGKLYTSRYVRKLPQKTGQDWKEVFIAHCPNEKCNTWNYRTTKPSGDDELCVSCKTRLSKKFWHSAIEPRKGFIADPVVKDAPMTKPDRLYKSEDFYIGDPMRKIMISKTFEIGNGHKIRLETSANDSLMVKCRDEFFICPKCGFGISQADAAKEKHNQNKAYIEHKHKNAWGYTCDGKLYKKSLCHTFKTDVVRIEFGTADANNRNTMLSVMYALLEGASQALDIERTDLKGCLHTVQYKNNLINEIILYDAVPGGAGHVRRLIGDNYEVFRTIVNKAIEITKSCTCSPSCYNCLRNYYNQDFHNILDRKAAYEFLEKFNAPGDAISSDKFEEDAKSHSTQAVPQIKLGDAYLCEDYDSWEELASVLPPECEDLLCRMDSYQIPLPYAADQYITVEGCFKNKKALLFWKNEKILVFLDEVPTINVDGWTCLHFHEMELPAFRNLFGGN